MLRHIALQVVHDFFRCAGRCQQAQPAGDDHRREARLAHGRRVGEDGIARLAASREQAQLARIDMLRSARQRCKQQRDLSADEVSHRRRLSFVRHVRQFEIGGQREQFAREMGLVANAERSVVELAGTRAAQRDEFLHRPDRQSRIDQQAEWIVGGLGDRHEILERVVRQFLVDVRVHGQRARHGMHQRIAVGFGFGDGFHADDAVRARAVFHDYLLAHGLGNLLPDGARDDVRPRSRRLRHDDADGTVRIILCLRRRVHGNQQSRCAGPHCKQNAFHLYLTFSGRDGV